MVTFRTYNTCRNFTRAGFSIVEVLIAMSVFMIGSLAVFSLLSTSIELRKSTAETVRSTSNMGNILARFAAAKPNQINDPNTGWSVHRRYFTHTDATLDAPSDDLPLTSATGVSIEAKRSLQYLGLLSADALPTNEMRVYVDYFRAISELDEAGKPRTPSTTHAYGVTKFVDNQDPPYDPRKNWHDETLRLPATGTWAEWRGNGLVTDSEPIAVRITVLYGREVGGTWKTDSKWAVHTMLKYP